MTEERDNDSAVDVFEESSLAKPHEPNPSWAELPSADMLSIDAADAWLRSRPANLITIIGERTGGKTTLITEAGKSGLWGTRVSGRVDSGSGRIMKKKKTKEN